MPTDSGNGHTAPCRATDGTLTRALMGSRSGQPLSALRDLTWSFNSFAETMQVRLIGSGIRNIRAVLTSVSVRRSPWCEARYDGDST